MRRSIDNDRKRAAMPTDSPATRTNDSGKR
jgi:hypothetical protein